MSRARKSNHRKSKGAPRAVPNHTAEQFVDSFMDQLILGTESEMLSRRAKAAHARRTASPPKPDSCPIAPPYGAGPSAVRFVIEQQGGQVTGLSLEANPDFDARAVYEGLWEAARDEGGYYCLVMPDGLAIYGRVTGTLNDLDDLRMWNQRVLQVTAYSVVVPEGENGSAFLADVLPISKASFERARERDWPEVQHALTDPDYFALNALMAYRPHAG